jgi:hypothetical protein
MVDKKEDSKEKYPFSDSSEIFESIFKQATQEIHKEAGKVVGKPILKPKSKPEVKPKPEAKAKAPTKVEHKPKEEAEPKIEKKPRFEQKPKLQTPIFKPQQEPIRKPITGTPGTKEQKEGAGVISAGPLVRRRVQGQQPKEQAAGKPGKPMPPKKSEKGSPVLKILLLLLLLVVGVGAASVYFGIIDVSDYVGRPEPATKEAPKVVASKMPLPQTAAKQPPAAPKAAQPSQPQTKPAESPKPPAQIQTVQPPQAPPKPVEAVTPPPPSPPSEVQAKPETPAPQVAAKAGTPSPAVQPPARVEPQAPLVTGPVKSQPQAAPEPVQPQAVPKKAEIPQRSSELHPYSVYLGSFQNPEYLKKAMSVYKDQGLSPYWAKIELKGKGTWYRFFTGYFRSAQEAEAFIQQNRIKDGEVKETRYANLIGTFRTKQEGEEKILALTRMGLSAYLIPGADGQVRVYSGAFTPTENAEKNQEELNSKGIISQVVER